VFEIRSERGMKMLYYRYELRWKNYKELMTLEKDERSEFEMKYSNSFLNSLNEDLYRRFLKNERKRKKIKYLDSISSQLIKLRKRLLMGGYNYV
jgi:hypothetical protein